MQASSRQTVSTESLLPYRTDMLANLGLSLGRPTVYRCARLEGVGAFAKVYVLDMSTFYWSHTLKDPRSWAILNVAIAKGIRHLALYTAGNAGISLARLAYAVNKRLAPEQRISIYALVDETVAPKFEPFCRTQAAKLRRW